MTICLAGLSAVAVLSCASAAGADEILGAFGRGGAIETCASQGTTMTCGRFQGYVVVGHGRSPRNAAGAFAIGSQRDEASSGVDGSMGEGRVYLKTGAGD